MTLYDHAMNAEYAFVHFVMRNGKNILPKMLKSFNLDFLENMHEQTHA